MWGGELVPGDCWSSTLFFTDTAQSGGVAGVLGLAVGVVGKQIVGDRVYRKTVGGEQRYPSAD